MPVPRHTTRLARLCLELRRVREALGSGERSWASRGPDRDERLDEPLTRIDRSDGTPDEAERDAAAVAASKVVGLGAPVSVRVSVARSEVPLLLLAIGDELAHHGCASEINGRTVTPEVGVDARASRSHVAELHQMLGELEEASTRLAYPPRPIAVLWPTVLAHGVLRGAVRHGERRAAEATGYEGELAEEALAAARQTLRDYTAVDNGGLLDSWL